MFVPCPHCGFLVALIVGADAATQRCPRCENLLQDDADTPGDGVIADVADTSEGAGPPDPARDSGHSTPEPDLNPEHDPVAAIVAGADAAAEASTTAPPAPSGEARPRRRVRRRDAPSFVRTAAPTLASGPRWPRILAVVALSLLLAGQLLFVQRDELGANDRWRPLITAFCRPLGCTIAPWREPGAITMLQRGVRPHPGKPGVLAVEASFRNDARWPQPWPLLVLSLADVDGRTVGQRAFAPAEYRATTEPAMLAPGQSARVQLEIVEPAPGIVAFTFDFR